MKKRLLAIVCFIMALMMSVACLGGCNLVVTDSEKDMQQVVATVSIEDGVESKMYKLDLVMDYIVYVSQYGQGSSMTMEEMLDMLVDSRVDTMILYQYAMKYLNENNQVARPEITDKWNPSRYITEDQETEAKYDIYKGINNMLDSFIEEEESSKVTDSSSASPRTVPTGATPFEKEVTLQEKESYINKGFDVKSSVERREAFNKFINYLKINTLLGADYVVGDITTTAYYKSNLENAIENLVLEKYEQLKKDEYLLTYADKNGDNAHNFADVEELFIEQANDQKDFDTDAFVEILDSASNTSPILFSQYGTYGYVYNLLLGVDSIQEQLINNIDKTLSNEARANEVKNILSTTRVKDLRDTWITSGYDFDFTPSVEGSNEGTAKFTNDYALAKQTLPFQGTVTRVKEATEEDEKDKYTASSKTFGLDEFISLMHEYMTTNLNGSSATKIEDKTPYNSPSNPALIKSIYSAGKYQGAIEEYEEKINELLFAFSTDPGSLNPYKGYAIKPPVDGDNQEQYVETFADAGRILLEQGEQSYVIVASDYGYHVLFFSQKYDSNDGFIYQENGQPSLNVFMNEEYKLDTEKYLTWEKYYEEMMKNFFDWEDTNNYLYALQNTNLSDRVKADYNQETSSISTKYRYELKDKVTINEKSYQDLIK